MYDFRGSRTCRDRFRSDILFYLYVCVTRSLGIFVRFFFVCCSRRLCKVFFTRMLSGQVKDTRQLLSLYAVTRHSYLARTCLKRRGRCVQIDDLKNGNENLLCYFNQKRPESFVLSLLGKRSSLRVRGRERNDRFETFTNLLLGVLSSLKT